MSGYVRGATRDSIYRGRKAMFKTTFLKCALFVVLTVALGLVGLGPWPETRAQEQATGGMAFKDVMDEVGTADPTLTWHGYHDTVICADWDNDGDVDILVAISPHSKSPYAGSGRMLVNLLKETGKLKFENRTEQLLPGGISKRVMADTFPYFLDLDADGWLDLASISDEGGSCTFHNNGKGIFSLENWGFGASWLLIKDINGDGALDVVSLETGLIYVNDGKGKFTLSKDNFGYICGGGPHGALPTPPGIEVDVETKTKAAVARVCYIWQKIDLNGDGIGDYMLMLSAPYGPKWTRFYAGSKDGKFRDVTVETGLPPFAAIELADVDGNDIDDAFVQCTTPESGIYLGDGKGHFKKVADNEEVDKPMRVSCGCYKHPDVLVDFNNDGIPDLATMRYREGGHSALLQGLGGGRFKLVQRTNASWGQFVADLDNDGLLDVVAANDRLPGVHVWKNVSTGAGSYLRVLLKGAGKNPFAANAVVEVFPTGSLGKNDKRLGKCVAGADGLPLHFGLAKLDKVDLKVTFADGKVVQKKNVKPNETLTVEEK
jgi:hypothetical protein